MITSRKPENKSLEIKVDNEILQQVMKFICLDTEINQDVRLDKEFKEDATLPKRSLVKLQIY